MAEIVLDGKTYPVERPKLRKWLELEQFRDSILTNAEGRNNSGIADGIISSLSAFLGLDADSLEELPWYEVGVAFTLTAKVSAPTLDLSIINGSREKKKSSTPDPWEYAERSYYLWLHILCSTYNWNTEYVDNLDVDTALALIQEIMIDEQLEKEWQWGMFEGAYDYDKGSGKSRLKQLPRPSWMKRATKQVAEELEKPKQIAIPVKFAPMGLILRDDDTTTKSEESSGTE